MIKVEHLKKSYAAAVAVDDISFEVGKNEIVGFLGPNGAGKSTTLKVLTCSHSASDGKVILDGKDVFEDPEGVKSVIGYLPENVPLYPELRVREYLNYRAGLKGISGKKRGAAIDKAMSLCRIEEVQHRIIGQLSKGYRQRVGLADALLADPKILILDEPTVGLDPNQIRDVRELIKQLGQERTVLLSSHILPEVEAVCSRVIIINRGKIVGQGKPAELRQRLHRQERIIEVELRESDKKIALEKLETLEAVAGISKGKESETQYLIHLQQNTESTGDVRERIFDAAVKYGFKLLAMYEQPRSLEDIFVEIITQETDAESADAVKNAENADTGAIAGQPTSDVQTKGEETQ